MNKKECLKHLNKMLGLIAELNCFEDICRELDIEEDELELILSSKITNITNDDLE
jgi:hypothetical protein